MRIQSGKRPECWASKSPTNGSEDMKRKFLRGQVGCVFRIENDEKSLLPKPACAGLVFFFFGNLRPAVATTTAALDGTKRRPITFVSCGDLHQRPQYILG